MIRYVKQLREYGLTNIVIVDDGSDEAYQSIFEELHENGCVLLRHAAEDVYRPAVEARRHHWFLA
ncbi:family 2 glycosyl transferase [Paenibacillus macerans]|nr:hypothetical protein PbJCM17693_41650 [Paenibacillus macerans]SUA82189.1 family 2 glycosyl transferase [Paenibacillus macerans]